MKSARLRIMLALVIALTLVIGSISAAGAGARLMIHVESVSLNRGDSPASALTMTAGTTDFLTAVILPGNASNKRVTWTSSNKQVAEVVGIPELRTGCQINAAVTGVKAGNATIVVVTADGREKASCNVAVTSPDSNWLSGYSYRKQITIKGTTAGNQTEYQMKLTICKNYGSTDDNGQALPIYSNTYPHAYEYNGKTYVVWQGIDCDPYIDCYDHSTGLWHGPAKVGTNPLSGDYHGAPAVIVTNDDYIHVFFGCHSAEGDAAVKHSRSTNAGDISLWTAQNDVRFTSGATYPMVVKDTSGNLWLFARDYASGSGPEAYRKSVDNGMSWGSVNRIIDVDDTGDGIYVSNPAYDSVSGRIHFAWSYADRSETPPIINIYHAYLKLSDGKMYSMNAIGLGSNVSRSEADTFCKIVSDTTHGTGYNRKIRLDSSGYPHIVYYKQSNIAYYIHYNGSSWDADPGTQITTDNTGGGALYVSNAYDITAYLPVNATLEKWEWNGSNWTKDSTIMASDKFKGDGVRVAQEVEGYSNGLKIVFADTDSDDFANSDLQVFALDSSDRFIAGYGGVDLEGSCQDDFDDIRFTQSDGISETHYWIDPSSMLAGEKCEVWIEFNLIPASPNSGTFYIYYNNDSATSSSDGENTFVAWDDFDTGYDLGDEPKAGRGWIVENRGGSDILQIATDPADENNKALHYRENGVGGSALVLRNSFSQQLNMLIEMRFRWETMVYQLRTDILDINDSASYIITRAVAGDSFELKWYGSSYQSYSPAWTPTAATWYGLDFECLSDDFDLFVDGSEKSGGVRYPGDGYDRLSVYGSATYTDEFYLDKFRVRTYADPEPTWGGFGSEEGVNLEITTATLPEGELGHIYSATLEAIGSNPPYTWAVTGLPADLTCSAIGVISGIPTEDGDFAVTVTVTDSFSPPNIDNKELTLTITATNGRVMISIDAPGEVAEGSDFIADVVVDYVEDFDSCGFNVTYDETIITVIDVTGGEIDGHTIDVDEWHYVPASSPGDTGRIRVLALVPGAPAPGVTGTGYIAQIHYHVLGSPGQTSAIHLEDLAIYDYQAQQIDTVTEDDSVHVVFPSLETTTTTSPDGKVGDAYSATLEATGGKTPYTWNAVGLPAGLTCSAAGVISGTPVDEVGDFTVTVTVTDALANSDSTDLTVKISCKRGDANMDGVVDAGDITKVKRTYFELDPATPCADVNGDGPIDTGDITAIKVIYFS